MNGRESGPMPVSEAEQQVWVFTDKPDGMDAALRMLSSADLHVEMLDVDLLDAISNAQGCAVLVVDVYRCDAEGLGFCRSLRLHPVLAGIPLVLMTDGLAGVDFAKEEGAAADAYLQRPVAPDAVLATVELLVRTSAAEHGMRTSEVMLREVYAEAPNGVALLDAEGRFVDANVAMAMLLGHSTDSLKGRAIADFIPPDSSHQAEQFVRSKDGKLVRFECDLLSATGQLLQLEWSVSAHIKPGVHMAVAHDASPPMRLERHFQQLLDRERAARTEAERVSRMKDDFIAVLSHELRTPLNAIMQWAHILHKRGGNEEAMRGLASIERNVNIQARMIADLLDMSRLNMGKLPLWFESLDPAEAVWAAVHAMQRSFDDNENVVCVDIAPPYRPIRADSARLQQVIWNLLTNAIKFSPRGSKITIGLSQDRRGLTLWVSDEGQGMAPEFISLAFDRFAQSHAAKNRYQGGLGLGLSIAKQLVEAHGGVISAFSAGLGQGATFKIWLPVDQGLTMVNVMPDDSGFGYLEGSEQAELALAGLTLLVVEDDREGANILQTILTDRGATVKLAHDYDTALDVFDAVQPDVLVSDIGLPGKDGYKLIKELRRREVFRYKRLPSIALTAFSRVQDQEHALAAGFDAHCSKPLRPLKLIRMIQQLVGGVAKPVL